ncbi:MAG: enoyl-CoA hydratase/isomerase family protein [Thermincola sp.]|nr:enoyl-CoA hydratase/isomerase family protein [Thermincola sp.]MDT3704978.1 enoyl-CoA hydratase/isomerase family protein [Thermincola sp.]
MIDYQYLIVNFVDGVGTISLNRPKKFNALSSKVMQEIGQAFDALSLEKKLRVVVLKGEEGNFAAGADVAEVSSIPDPSAGYVFAQAAGIIYDKIYSYPVPVVSSIDGYALGGGFELVLATDLRIASDAAKLGLPEVTLGLLPGGGGTQRLIRQIGFIKAKELLYTGRTITANEALELGLINKVVPKEKLEDETNKLVSRLASLPVETIKLIKRCVNIGAETDLNSASEFERQAFGALFSTRDAREGMLAFIEKRKPNFNSELEMK